MTSMLGTIAVFFLLFGLLRTIHGKTFAFGAIAVGWAFGIAASLQVVDNLGEAAAFTETLLRAGAITLISICVYWLGRRNKRGAAHNASEG